MSRRLSPEDRYTETRRVVKLAEHLRAFVSGREDRAALARWTEETWPSDRRGSPFRYHDVAHAIFQSLRFVEATDGDAFIVRPQDVAGYLGWLTTGDAFVCPNEPLLSVSTPIETLASSTGGQEVRRWTDEMGWEISLRFASAATGRGFQAVAPLRGDQERRSTIYASHYDDLNEAVVDLIEALPVDEAAWANWHPGIDLAKMPRWSVWRQDDNGGRFEVATFLAYSQAMRACQELESRGHKQMYWVRQKGQPA